MSVFNPVSLLYTVQSGTAHALKAIEDGTDWVLGAVAKVAQKADNSLHYLGMTNAGGLKARLEDESGSAISSSLDGSVNRMEVNTTLEARANDLYAVDIKVFKDDAGTNYYMGVHLHSGGNFKHPYVSGDWLRLTGISGQLIKEKNLDSWDAGIGVILSINATEATIAWLHAGALHASDTGSFQSQAVSASFTNPLQLSIAAGDFDRILAGVLQTTTDINTGITLPDAKGSDVAPEVGDIVIGITRNQGSGDAEAHWEIRYYPKVAV